MSHVRKGARSDSGAARLASLVAAGVLTLLLVAATPGAGAAATGGSTAGATRQVTPPASTSLFATASWAITGLKGGLFVSSPVVATIDGVKAVVQATLGGEILVVNAKTGRELPGWPRWVHIHSSTPTAVDSSPAVAYLDGPAAPPSIVVGAGSLWVKNQQGGVEAFNANGSVRFVFQTKKTTYVWGRGPTPYSDPVFATPAIGDITGTGQQDIVFGSYDHFMYALQPNGKLVAGFPIQRADTIWSSPALADTSHTGRDDIIEGGDASGWYGCWGGWLVDYRYDAGSPHLVWQHCTAQGGKAGETIWSSPTVAVINSTGRPAIVVGASWDYGPNDTYLHSAVAHEVMAFYADNGSTVPGWPVHTDGPTFGSPSIGRVDGQLAIVSTSCAHCLQGPATISAWNGGGHLLWSHQYDPNDEALSSPALVDLTGGRDNGNDVLVGGAGGLFLLSGKTGAYMYNVGTHRAAVQIGCDHAGTPAVAYVPGAPGSGWMMFVACGGPRTTVTLAAYPLPVAPATSDPPAWPEWRANAARTGVADPTSVRQHPCSTPSSRPAGFRMSQADGALFDFGNLAYCGGANSVVLPTRVVSMASTANGGGYWLLLADGSVYAFGDAKWYGDLRGSAWRGGPTPPGAPAVGIVASPTGHGYLIASADGSVYAFGGAPYHGSRGGQHNGGPIVAIAVDHATGGYWLVTARGAVYGFDAPNHGSAGGLHLAAPIVAMAATSNGGGYWLAGANGTVHHYGDAKLGSGSIARLRGKIVGIVAGPNNGGYWLAASSGEIYRYGSVPPYGASSRSLVDPVTAIAGP